MISDKRNFFNQAKTMVLSVVLYVLYAAFYELKDMDSRFMEEVDDWEDKICYRIRVMNNGPSLILMKRKGKFVRYQNLPDQLIHVDMMIKSIDSAFIIFTGRMSVAQAYAKHTFTVRGEIADTMKMARCVDLAEANLFPKLITKRILKEVPEREIGVVSLYACILIGILKGRYRAKIYKRNPKCKQI